MGIVELVACRLAALEEGYGAGRVGAEEGGALNAAVLTLWARAQPLNPVLCSSPPLLSPVQRAHPYFRVVFRCSLISPGAHIRPLPEGSTCVMC